MDSNSEVVTKVPENEQSQSANNTEANEESQVVNPDETVSVTTNEVTQNDGGDSQTKTTTTTTVIVAKKDNGEETTTTTTTVSVEAPDPDDVVTVTVESEEVEAEPTTETNVEIVAKTPSRESNEPTASDTQIATESSIVAADGSDEPKEKDVVSEIESNSVKEETQDKSKNVEETEEVEETETEADEEDNDDDEEDEEEEAEEKSNVAVDQPPKDTVRDPTKHEETASVTLKTPSIKIPEAEDKAVASVDQADAGEQVPIKKDFNDQIQDIISDIDVNIKAQEKITQLKEQELQLIQKQNELANQIKQQQILAQQLIAQNHLKQQQINAQQQQQQHQQQQHQQHQQHQQQQPARPEVFQPLPQTYKNGYGQGESFYDVKESTNVSKAVDLRKIFTPATDAPEILPKNRKLYASSAFYSPSLHPTVEDQVELARRISHSLSDISNQTSKGQSMYVNRKKRSVKWVHEGCAQEDDNAFETHSLYKENSEASILPELTKLDKLPLKLIMNPRGQVRDYNSVKESINIETGLLSPDNCAELITALQLHKGRGAELFAKRRRKAENWVVDETNAGTHSPSGIPDYQQYQPKPTTSPNIVPAYSDAGKHRVQLNIHQDQLIEKYSKPGLQVVKSPWEAALQTGSASSAFQEETRYRSQTPSLPAASPSGYDREDFSLSGSSRPFVPQQPTPPIPTQQNVLYNKPSVPTPVNPQRELAYKPSVAQGWGGRNVELPRDYNECFKPVAFEEDDGFIFRGDMGNSSNCARKERWYNPSPDFTIDVQNRLQQLEQFQQYFLDQQKRELEIFKLRENMRLWRAQAHRKSNGLETPTQSIEGVAHVQSQEAVDDSGLQVNVRELISSFEQQSLREYEATLQRAHRHSQHIPLPKEYRSQGDRSDEMLTKSDTEVEDDQLKTDAGLYVPKEISLASYAPPPNQYQVSPQSQYQPPSAGRGFTSTDSVSGVSGYSPRFAPVNDGSLSTGGNSVFPLSRPSSGFNTSAAVPEGVPRQQLNAPSSYQKVAQSAQQGGPQVNFNPSPLSFDKLSKFEQPDPYQGSTYGSSSPHSNQQRYLNVRYGSNVRNTSPSPFGLGQNEAPLPRNHVLRSPLLTPNLVQQDSSPKYATYRPPAQQNQSFNNCARGWGSSLGCGRQSAPTPRGTLASPSSLPYSDF